MQSRTQIQSSSSSFGKSKPVAKIQLNLQKVWYRYSYKYEHKPKYKADPPYLEKSSLATIQLNLSKRNLVHSPPNQAKYLKIQKQNTITLLFVYCCDDRNNLPEDDVHFQKINFQAFDSDFLL